MKFCKVIICFLFAVGFALGNGRNVSAEDKLPWSESFAGYMRKAKDHEDKKNWIWALFGYYCALEAWQNWDEAMAAYVAYSDLAKIIEDGMPGRGSFDQFSLYESWKKLLIETEMYGNQWFPYSLYFGSFEVVKLDLQNKTADYSVKMSFTLSNAYLRTIDVVARGYKKARQDSWTELPNNFPDEPLTKDSLWISNYGGTKCIPFSFCYESSKFTDCKSLVPYEAVFEVVDEGGAVLAKTEPYVIGDKTENLDGKSWNYIGPNLTFKNVPEETMKVIDSGKAFIRLKSVQLMHGDVEASYSVSGRRYFTGGKRTEVGFFVSQIHSCNTRSRAEFVFCAKSMLAEFEPDIKMAGKKIHCVFFDPIEVFRLGFGDENISLKKFLNWHNAFSKYEACLLCNILSKMLFRTSVYSLKGSDAIGDFMLINDFKGEDEIKTLVDADGLRMPTLEEIEKFLARSGDKSFPPVKDAGSLLTGEAFNYYSMNKSFKNDAYLMLYYLE